MDPLQTPHVAQRGPIGLKARASAQDAQLESTTMRQEAVLNQHARSVNLESTTMRQEAVHARAVDLESTTMRQQAVLHQHARTVNLESTTMS